jgi:hypothetical protein
MTFIVQITSRPEAGLRLSVRGHGTHSWAAMVRGHRLRGPSLRRQFPDISAKTP